MKDSYIPKVSVVIPVWNPGPGISLCIESLQNQTLKEIEMIFVDDRGTDDSIEKVRTAAAEDFRIRIIENEENIGTGPSRNKGIEAARGEYLSFVDSDDYVALDFLELLYSDAHNKQADIAKGCSHLIKEDGSHITKKSTANLIINNKLSTGIPLYAAFTRGHQNAIYRTDFILNQKIRYGVARRSQDVVFLLQACSLAKVFITNDDAYYYYCERTDSVVNKTSRESLDKYFEGISEIQEYTEKRLPKTRFTAEYLQNLFLLAIRELYRYKEDGVSYNTLSEYSESLREKISKSLYRETITLNSFPLRILCEYKLLLPIEPFYTAWDGNNPPVQYAKLVERWVDFYLATPEEAEECWKELRKIIAKASNAANGKPQTECSTKEQKEGKALLKKQIKRLPLTDRLQLAALQTKKIVRRLAARVLPKPIKKRIKTIIENARQQ